MNYLRIHKQDYDNPSLGTWMTQELIPFEGEIDRAKTALLMEAMRPTFSYGVILEECSTLESRNGTRIVFKVWKSGGTTYTNVIDYDSETKQCGA